MLTIITIWFLIAIVVAPLVGRMLASGTRPGSASTGRPGDVHLAGAERDRRVA